MKKSYIIFALIFAFTMPFMLAGDILAEQDIDLAQLEQSLRAGSGETKNIPILLQNAWLNGYDYCKISLAENEDSFVIEIAVRGLSSSLKALSRSEEEADAALLMEARDILLSQCAAVIDSLENAGAKDLHFSFVLLDDEKVLENAYARGAVMASVTVAGGRAVRIESVFEAWNGSILAAEGNEGTNGEASDASIIKKEPTYILNTSSKRFHHPMCDSVANTKEKNKKEFFGEREELLSMGYIPCGNCKP